MDAAAQLRKQTVADVRACLVIVKGSLEARQLDRDHQTMVGRAIPYRQLGHASLEEFLRSVETLVVRRAGDGAVYVDAKADGKSAHIGDMVARDKCKKRRPPGHGPPIAQHQQQQQPPQRWRPTNNGAAQRDYPPSPRVAMHNQFVTTSPKRQQAPPAQRNCNNFSNIKGMQTMHIGGGERPNKENLQPTEREPRTNLAYIMSRAKHRIDDDCADDDRDEFVESGDAAKDLYHFARFHRIDEPLVVVTTRKAKSSRVPEFYCSIKVDGQKFLSYPAEFYDEQSATLHLSAKVLAVLTQKYGRTRRQSLPVSSAEAILERVPKLVGEHYNGVWSWQVEANYKDTYQEAPPADWLEILAASPALTVENFVNNYVLRLRTPEDQLQKGAKAHSALACGVSIPTSSASFDERGFMTAQITCAVSAGEIWCRQVETTEATDFESLMEHMNRYYEDMANEQAANMPANRFVKGHYYAVWDQTWHRAQILEVRDGTGGALCQFVDRGDDRLVPFEKVCTLHRRYARAKAQAFVCRLAGLDELYEASQFADAVRKLDGAVVTLEMVDADADARRIVGVVMYDRATGLPHNDALLTSIAVEDATPSFDLERSFEVRVSHISPKGLFYVQTPSAGFEVFARLLQALEDDVPLHQSRARPPITPENADGKLYFAKLEEDARYRRVRIIDWAPNRQYAQVLAVDTGRACVVRLSDVALLPMEELSAALSGFPPQATLVRLHLRRAPDERLADRLKELIPLQTAVLLRVHGRDAADGLPSVMLFVPNLGGLVSVNDSVEFTKEAQLSPHSRLATPPDSPHNVPSTGVLQCPRVPTAREYFEVKVPFAVNPWNFFVQPRESAGQLADTMARLQATFAQRPGPDPVCLRDIKAGNIYAARRDADDAWCRVCVLKTIYPSAIVVFYVDFGNYANLGYQDLFALDKRFLDLPCQALKAKLAGIKPIQEKWSVDDCRYFEQLVQQREYVSVIKAVEKDELYPCDNVLVLTLIDTTSQLDVVIGDLLIQKKIAVKA